MKKLSLVLILTILSLSSFGQSPHYVTNEYVLDGGEQVEIEPSVHYVTLKFNGRGKVTIKLTNYDTGETQKIKMNVISTDCDHYLSHHAIFHLDHPEYGKMKLVTNDDAYKYSLYCEVDTLGNYHKLILM